MPDYLAPYQQEIVDKYLSNIEAGVLRNAVIMPSGTGKIAILAEILRIFHPKRVLVVTPHFPVFQRRIWTLPKELQEQFVNRCEIYEQDTLEYSTNIHLYDMVVIDGFSRSATQWKWTIRYILSKAENIPIFGMSTTTLHFSYDEQDLGEEVFHGNYLAKIGLVEAWDREDVPIGMPKFVTSKDPWVKNVLEMRRKINVEKMSVKHLVENGTLSEQLVPALESHTVRADFIQHLPKRNGKYLVFCRYVDEVPLLEEWLSYCLREEVEDIHFYSYHYETIDPYSELEGFTYDESPAIKFLTAINMIGDDDSIACDGVLIARPTQSLNIYLRLLAQASQAGDGALVMDLTDTISTASQWDLEFDVDTIDSRELRMLHTTVAKCFGVTPKYYREGYKDSWNTSKRRSQQASSTNYIDRFISQRVYSSTPWTRKEDSVLIDNAPFMGATFIRWKEKLPGRSAQEITSRARELGIAFVKPKAKWTRKEADKVRKHYPVHGPLWEGWSDRLPRRSAIDIIQKARRMHVYIRDLPWSERQLKRLKILYPIHGPNWNGWDSDEGIPDHSLDDILQMVVELDLIDVKQKETEDALVAEKGEAEIDSAPDRPSAENLAALAARFNKDRRLR